MPKSHAATLEREGIILLEEGIGGRIALENFGRPGAAWRTSGKRRWFTGSLVVTRQSFTAFAFSKRILAAPRERFHELRSSVDGEGRLHIACEASAFSSQWTGSIECRFDTPMAQAFLEQLTSRDSTAAPPTLARTRASGV